MAIPNIVIPDKGGDADRRAGIRLLGAAKLHKILDPVCVKLALQVTNGMTGIGGMYSVRF